ncbi:phosphohydrolase [Flammeovirgaceae bacterium SG7u.111]|nr:phosphohydrolase [Flammeovirgaceae bacterium SG7u.132]WPO38322.1 phosphohydrolase [Flammeovirgaceae bacterium SG7u.111]
MLDKTKKFAISEHANCNHMYDGKPYATHLQMVADVAERFLYLIPEAKRETVLCGCWVHDLIEDARQTYNDVKKETNEEIAELAYALTNEKGKNRKERANDKYYQGIRETPFASFIKMCDRIANFEYSKKSRSRMTEVYKKENAEFISKIYVEGLDDMVDYLKHL